MTREELWKKLDTDSSIVEHLVYLYERWLDEGEYESIDNYLKSIKKSIPEATSVTDVGFVIMCECSDGVLQVYFEVGEDNQLTLNGVFM